MFSLLEWVCGLEIKYDFDWLPAKIIRRVVLFCFGVGVACFDAVRMPGMIKQQSTYSFKSSFTLLFMCDLFHSI